MIILKMAKAKVNNRKAAPLFSELVQSLSKHLRPLLAPTLALQAEVLNLPVEQVRSEPDMRPSRYAPYMRQAPDFAEIFTDGDSFCLLEISRQQPPELDPNGEDLVLKAYYIGKDYPPKGQKEVEEAVKTTFGVILKPDPYISNRFDELKKEGRSAPSRPTEKEMQGTAVLRDKATRSLAISIKASGGLLVRDLSKQLPQGERKRTNEVQKALQESGLIASEIVIICRKTQAQTGRVPSREILADISQQGVKCACGCPVAEEQIEEALTITDLGRGLLDNSRWLTLLVLAELESIGVPLERVLIEQQDGGDELDLIAEISGEMVFFELKDKEFSLGNAYSFGAKIGIVRPDYPVIISTEYVGGDAKDHFQRALRAQRRPSRNPFNEEESQVSYIEGLDKLVSGIRSLAGEIYRKDVIRVIESMLSLASISPASIALAVENKDSRVLDSTQ